MTDPFADLPRNHFGVILADPPWPFRTWSAKGMGRSAENHYRTMSHSNLESLPVAELAAADCVLFLWVVQTQLPQAVRLIEAWGFEQKTVAFVWVKGEACTLFPDDNIKLQMGCGYWTRAGAEQFWLATRGKQKRLDAGVRQVLIEKRREHSRKPDEVYDRIERLVGGPYLELFARQRRPGWTVWGDQVDRFGPLPGDDLDIRNTSLYRPVAL